jgi:hypothetical protein
VLKTEGDDLKDKLDQAKRDAEARALRAGLGACRCPLRCTAPHEAIR